MQQFTRFLFVLFCFVSYFAIYLLDFCICFVRFYAVVFVFFCTEMLSFHLTSPYRVYLNVLYSGVLFFLLLPRLHMFVCVYVRKMCVCAMVLLAMACFFFISVSVCLWVNSVVFFLFFWCMLLIEFAFAVWVFLALATVLYWMNYNRVKRIFALLPPSLSFSHILVGCSFYSVALIKYQHQDLLK